MITRREFLSALAGAAIVGSAASAPALANHSNDGVPQARSKDMLKDGSGGGTPDGHPQNRGENNARTEGNPVLGGAGTTVGGKQNGQARAFRGGGTCSGGGGPHGDMDGTCDGTGTCDGSGPDN
jgi:hypothetical protein